MLGQVNFVWTPLVYLECRKTFHIAWDTNVRISSAGFQQAMTNSTQEGQLHMHVTHIYFIRRFMNLYVWDIRGALRASKHIHQCHSEGSRQCIKNLSLRFIQDHRLAVVDETVLKE